jgi:hypothetical protein
MENNSADAVAVPLPASATRAVDKFYALIDEGHAPTEVTRRVFFEFLRTKPTLSLNETETLWAVADLLADLEKARPDLEKLRKSAA